MKNDLMLAVLHAVAGRMCELTETGEDMNADEMAVLAGSLQFCLHAVEDVLNFQAELQSQNILLSREVRQNEALIDQLRRVAPLRAEVQADAAVATVRGGN